MIAAVSLEPVIALRSKASRRIDLVTTGASPREEQIAWDPIVRELRALEVVIAPEWADSGSVLWDGKSPRNLARYTIRWGSSAGYKTHRDWVPANGVVERVVANWCELTVQPLANATFRQTYTIGVHQALEHPQRSFPLRRLGFQDDDFFYPVGAREMKIGAFWPDMLVQQQAPDGTVLEARLAGEWEDWTPLHPSANKATGAEDFAGSGAERDLDSVPQGATWVLFR